MSTYNDIQSHILYGIYGKGSHHHTDYGVGNHPMHHSHPLMKRGGNSDPRYWDYPKRSDLMNTAQVQYGGKRHKRGCGYPPRYLNASQFDKGLTYYKKGIRTTKSPNTYIGGSKTLL